MAHGAVRRKGGREADDGRTVREDEIIDHSSLLSNGAAPRDAQELLGCADVSTTMNIYAHATKEAKRTSARLLDKAAVGGE